MEKLAINGGPKVRTKLCAQNLLDIDEDEIFEVMEVLKSGRMTQLIALWSGAKETKADEFEEALAKYFGVKYAVLCNSGSTAIAASLYACGVGAGDEVLFPAREAIMAAQAVIAVCARPIFVDVDPKVPWNIDPNDIPRRITKRTKAIMPVHWGGYPVDMDPVLEVAEEHGLPVIEDAAHAHGSEYKGRKCGTMGVSNAFSLWQQKALGVGEGGHILTNDPEITSKVSTFINNGRVVTEPGLTIGMAMRAGKVAEGAGQMGFTARMPEVQAAIGLAQLRKLDKHIAKKERLWETLKKGVCQFGGVSEPYIAPYVTRLNHYGTLGFGFDEEEIGVDVGGFSRAVRAEGVNCNASPASLPIFLAPLFQKKLGWGRGCPYDCPHFDKPITYRKGLCPVAERPPNPSIHFPLYYDSTEEEVEDMVKATEKVIAAVKAGAKIPPASS